MQKDSGYCEKVENIRNERQIEGGGATLVVIERKKVKSAKNLASQLLEIHKKCVKMKRTKAVGLSKCNLFAWLLILDPLHMFLYFPLISDNC